MFLTIGDGLRYSLKTKNVKRMVVEADSYGPQS